jgi:predicted 3-demethylubiquinone-9 3-methyltransferase (glyoxalase superfamily)
MTVSPGAPAVRIQVGLSASVSVTPADTVVAAPANARHPANSDYWDKLSQGGDPRAQQCGWLKDKFGLSWQIVPTALQELLNNVDQERADHVFLTMLKMKKLNIEELEQAAHQPVGG